MWGGRPAGFPHPLSRLPALLVSVCSVPDLSLGVPLGGVGSGTDDPYGGLRGELAEPYQLQVADDWQEASRLWTILGCPYETALALHDAGDEAALRQALKIFTGLGAPAAIQLTRHKMRTLGIRSIPAGPRTATRADPLGLTRREREVLELICAGHINAEIAAKLFLSTKTVNHHVSAVSAKLGTPTRQAAAAHAAQFGLADAPET